MTTGRRPAGEWRGLVQEWRRSGETREAFASARGLRSATLGWWASELTRRSRLPPTEKERSTGNEPTMFVPVHVVGETSSLRVAAAVEARGSETGQARSERYAEILLGSGRMLRVPVGADAAWVGQLAAALLAGERC